MKATSSLTFLRFRYNRCSSGEIGRKWIVTDLGKFAVHTTRKRLIGVQRALKADDKAYRAFES